MKMTGTFIDENGETWVKPMFPTQPIPTKPLELGNKIYACPSCESVEISKGYGFCPDCGQRIDWFDTKDVEDNTKEEILAKYYSLNLVDKMFVLSAILYDLDVGDYSAVDRANDWSECFNAMINHVERYLKYAVLSEQQIGLERRAKALGKFLAEGFEEGVNNGQ